MWGMELRLTGGDEKKMARRKGIWVIPCEINTKNGRMSQISLKLCAHIIYEEE